MSYNKHKLSHGVTEKSTSKGNVNRDFKMSVNVYEHDITVRVVLGRAE